MNRCLSYSRQQQQTLSRFFLQTNSKAALATELESLRIKLDPSLDSAHRMEVEALQASLDERDRTIQQLKDQVCDCEVFCGNERQ